MRSSSPFFVPSDDSNGIMDDDEPFLDTHSQDVSHAIEKTCNEDLEIILSDQDEELINDDDDDDANNTEDDEDLFWATDRVARQDQFGEDMNASFASLVIHPEAQEAEKEDELMEDDDELRVLLDRHRKMQNAQLEAPIHDDSSEKASQLDTSTNSQESNTSNTTRTSNTITSVDQVDYDLDTSEGRRCVLLPPSS